MPATLLSAAFTPGKSNIKLAVGNSGTELAVGNPETGHLDGVGDAEDMDMELAAAIRLSQVEY